MAKAHQYKFCFGPWNLSEGQDPYGPTTRPAQTFDWKLTQLKKLGFDAMMFHDDDAVPDIDGKSDAQLRKETRELKKKLADAGLEKNMLVTFILGVTVFHEPFTRAQLIGFSTVWTALVVFAVEGFIAHRTPAPIEF